MFEKTAVREVRWLIVFAWVHRANVVLNFLLFGAFQIFDIEPKQIVGLLALTALMAFCSTMFFAIRALTNRNARNDFMLGAFWLIFVLFAVRSLFMEPHDMQLFKRY